MLDASAQVLSQRRFVCLNPTNRVVAWVGKTPLAKVVGKPAFFAVAFLPQALFYRRLNAIAIAPL
ncbi:MAG: hypothetical protein ACHBN1_10660 [Heteroscytonema crispum UTEX LB 1556]